MKKQSKGFTLVELMVAVAIGGVTSLVLASIFVFSANQFQSLIDQNEAEESLLLSSYYLRATLSQAVKTTLAAGDPTAAFNLGLFTPPKPPNVARGYIDSNRTCADATCTVDAGWPAGVNALAVFVRENGPINIVANGTWAASQFVPTGIYYRPPVGVVSGRIYVVQGLIPVTITDTDAALSPLGFVFDRVVAFGITAGNAAACPATAGVYAGAIPCINLYVRTRYFKGDMVKNYSSDPVVAGAAGTFFRDIDMTININLRNNIINTSTTGAGTQTERSLGGLYFFRFSAPSLSDF